MILSINSRNPQPRLIRKAVDTLRDGGVIVYPTDTVYGLGCDLTNKRGIEKIYSITGRSVKQPLSFICADLKDISQYALVSDFAYKTMRRLLPGPYTFVLEASRMVPKILLPKRQTTGIRVPDCPIALALVHELGRPIISASVKSGDGDLMNDPQAIRERYGHCVDLILDAGILPAAQSSVVSLVDDEVDILRIGKGDVSAFQ